MIAFNYAGAGTPVTAWTAHGGHFEHGFLAPDGGYAIRNTDTFQPELYEGGAITFTVQVQGAGFAEADFDIDCGANAGPTPEPTPNTAPVAVAQALTTDADASLDILLAGRDADGDTLAYRIVSGPDSGTLAGRAPAIVYTPTPGFAGQDTFTFEVNDGQATSDAVSVVVDVVGRNGPPVANAGLDLTLAVGTSITLAGTANDPDGDPVSYAWTLVSAPEGSTSALAGATTATPSFVPDVAGDYSVALVASDGALRSASDTVVVTASPVDRNRPPVAVLYTEYANGDFPGTPNVFAWNSTDPDGDRLTYRWTFVGPDPVPADLELVDVFGNGSWMYLDGPPNVERDVVVELVVNDGELDSEPVRQALRFSSTPPDAVITLVQDGNDVSFDALASTGPDGVELDYYWTVKKEGEPSGRGFVDGLVSATPRFVGTEPGRYIVTLRVSYGQSAPDVATETFELGFDLDGPHERPRLAAWPFPNEDAGSSFPEDDWRAYAYSPRKLIVEGNDGPRALTYEARYVVSPPGAALRPSAGSEQSGWFGPLQQTTIEIDPGLGGQVGMDLGRPDVAPSGDYELHVTAFDGELRSEPFVFRFTLDRSPRLVKDPYTDFFTNGFDVRVNEAFDIGVEGSFDPEGDELIAEWTISRRPDGSAATLAGTGDRRSLVPDVEGVYGINLRVSDSYGNSNAGYWRLTATGTLYPTAVAEAGADRSVVAGRPVRLDGSASRGRTDDSSLEYTWTVTERPAGSDVPSALGARPTAALTPDLPGTYRVELVVVDSFDGGVVRDSVSIVAEANGRPVARITRVDGPAESVEMGTAVTLDGSGSSDPDGDTLNHVWRLVAAPVGSTVTLENEDRASISFTPRIPGTYTIELVVDDGQESSVAETLAIRVTDPLATDPPVAVLAVADGPWFVGRPIVFDASASTTSGSRRRFSWSLRRAVGSGASLARAPSDPWSSQRLIADVAGVYEITVGVSDGERDSEPVTLSVRVVQENPDNAPPVAVVQTLPDVLPDTLILLTGAYSHDPDGTLDLDYVWDVRGPAGDVVELDPLDRLTRGLRPTVPGTYRVSLTVNDGIVDSDRATRSFTVVTAGESVPADPAMAGRETIAGIDSDDDGVRDDVQRYIVANLPDEVDQRAAAFQFARALDAQLRGTIDPEEGAQVLVDLSLAIECLGLRFDDHGAVVREVTAVSLNTFERFEAYAIAERATTGVIVIGNPIETWEASCR